MSVPCEPYTELSTSVNDVIGGVWDNALIVERSALMTAGVPFAGLLALLVLVLGIAQMPALFVMLLVIVHMWTERKLQVAS